MILRNMSLPRGTRHWLLFASFYILLSTAVASRGDQLPEFKECVDVCIKENCGPSDHLQIRKFNVVRKEYWTQAYITSALHRRLLLWTCPSECDYTCQHITTESLVANRREVEQYHGKWPFYRLLGIQEPASVFFSLLNFLAHYNGLQKIRTIIPHGYPLRSIYKIIAYLGMNAWVFSMVFHVRDFAVTEQLDYFAAGATVLYGLYYTPIRIFRLYRAHPSSKTGSFLRLWTAACIAAYLAHVCYLKYYDWNYTYNMAANVICGLLQNVLWSWFSWNTYRKTKRGWTVWPGIVVAWVLCAMSLELLDFPPVWGVFDAHSLWHLGTVAPVVLFYNFLMKDALDDMAGARLKQ